MPNGLKRFFNARRGAPTATADDQIRTFGLWLYLLSDGVFFAVLFAVHAVVKHGLHHDAEDYRRFFRMSHAAKQTFLLLLSSACLHASGLRSRWFRGRSVVLGWIGASMLLGSGFVFLECRELLHWIHGGMTPASHAFCSSVFALLTAHAAHAVFGLVWMSIVLVRIARNGITARDATRLAHVGVFWHTVDIAWIVLSTVVYLL